MATVNSRVYKRNEKSRFGQKNATRDPKTQESEKQEHPTQALHQKDRQIVVACQEWVSCSEKLKKELTAYPKGTSQENEQLEALLEELSEFSEKSEMKMKFLTMKVAKEANVELNTRLTPRKKRQAHPEVKKNRGGTFVFYAFLLFIVIILSTVLNGQSDSGTPKNISGFSPMTVLTKSMQSVYPQYSFVLTQVTDPKQLTIGDDVTYMKENNTTVTHRIVGINENFMGEGKRGFETKGVENPRKDEEVVRAENVIGKVVFSSLLLGKALLFVRENMILTAITVIVLIYFMDALIRTLKMPSGKKKTGKKTKKKKRGEIR